MRCADKVNEFKGVVESTTTWAASNPGTSVTPGASNTFGSYVQLINGSSAWATDSGDGYQIEILVSNSSVSSLAKDTLVTVGIDLAGGTTYKTLISNLVCGPTAGLDSGHAGVWWTFRLRIPRGASIAAKASVNNAAAGTVVVACRIRIKPTQPDLIRWGSYVRTFGDNAATSAGTSVTPGNSTAKGSYVSLGTVAAGDNLFDWQVGIGINNATMNNNACAADLALGDASTKNIIVRDLGVHPTTSEELSRDAHYAPSQAQPADIVYGRMASTSTALTGWSMAAYAVGG